MGKKRKKQEVYNESIRAADSRNLKRVTRLIELLQDEHISDETRRKLRNWLASPVSEEEKYEAIGNMMCREIEQYDWNRKPSAETTRSFGELRRRLGLDAEAKEETAPRPRLGIRKIAWRAAAVVIPLLFIAGGVYFGLVRSKKAPSPTIAERTIEVYRGVQKEVLLSDNSQVWVNSESKITFAEEFEDERRVSLQGEAYFKVERDEQKPFIVHTEHLDIRVLGTTFDVKAYPESGTTEVILYEGLVEVTAGRQSVRLASKEKVVYRHQTGEMYKTLFTNGSDDWRSDVITATDEPLGVIFHMIGNYYDREIVFDEATFRNSELFEISFGRNHQPEEVLEILCQLSGEAFSYEANDNEIRIIIN